MNTDASSYTPADKLDNRTVRNFLSATAMLGHLCALYDRGVFEAGRLMSSLLFQLAVKRKRNTPLLEQAGIQGTFRVIVDQTTLDSNLPSAATMSPLVGLMFGLRSDLGKRVPAAYRLPAVLKPEPVPPAFSALCVDAWLDDPVIPTTQKVLSRRELIDAVRDQDAGAHSDPDSKLQRSIGYV